MDIQIAFNVAISLIGFLGGYIIKTMQTSIDNCSAKLQNMEVTLAGKYVTTEILERQLNAIEAMLRRIEDKIDQKADKK